MTAIHNIQCSCILASWFKESWKITCNVGFSHKPKSSWNIYTYIPKIHFSELRYKNDIWKKLHFFCGSVNCELRLQLQTIQFLMVEKDATLEDARNPFLDINLGMQKGWWWRTLVDLIGSMHDETSGTTPIKQEHEAKKKLNQLDYTNPFLNLF